MKKLYLCIEHGEEFTVEAESLEQAREYASEWGGEAIGEYKERSHIYYKDFDKAISFGFNYPHNFGLMCGKTNPCWPTTCTQSFKSSSRRRGTALLPSSTFGMNLTIRTARFWLIGLTKTLNGTDESISSLRRKSSDYQSI